MDSYVIAQPRTGMFLAGKDHDERDESVICHEYGHWVYGTLRGDGKFMGGTHSSKKEVEAQLAYSEGLSTSFGQMVLNLAVYVDGNITTSSIYNDIESPTAKVRDHYKNEAYVTGSMWDIIDSYFNTEHWDNVKDDPKDVLQSTIDVVMKAGFMDFDITNPIHTTMAYDCTIRTFYDQYVDSYVTKNSMEALNLWTIYNKNGMQYDDENPKIELEDATENGFVVVNRSSNSIRMELYDNVKISKIEFHINGKPAGTYTMPADTFYYFIPMNMLKNGTNKLAIKAYDYAGKHKDKYSSISKAFPANDFYKASLDSDEVTRNFDNVAYRKPYEIEYVDLIFQEEGPAVSTLSYNDFHNLNSVNELDSSQVNVLENIEKLADTYSLLYKEYKYGILSSGQVSSSGEITISGGEDYAIFTDDTLGDFEITLIDPQGNEYSNSKEPEQYLTEDESKTQAVLNLGSSGMMLFNPVPGTWTYTIRNRGTTADYAIGIYTKPSAPMILNEDELLKIQDGSSVNLRASIGTRSTISVVTGSAISVVTGSAISVVTGSAVCIKLTGENTGVEIQDIIQDSIDVEGNFTYTFNDLPDDHYKVELFVTDGEGNKGWKKESSIIVDSTVPDILLEDDYEYYTYPGNAIIEGTAINSSRVMVYLNGTEVPIYGSGGNNINFATDYMKLNSGNNTILIIAETETGRKAVKELTLYSQPEEECYTEQHQPIIERVLFNEKEEALINEKSTIEVKLTDSNVNDYKVYAILPTPTRDYYTFKGWYNESQQILSDTIVTSYNTHNIIARWEPNIYKVTLDPNGGSVTQTSIDVTYEGIYNSLPNPKREGYVFIGWYDSLCGGNRISYDSVMNKPSDTILYARWKEDSNRVTFNVNGYDSTYKYVISNQVYGELPVATLWGYDFIGWYTDSSAGNLITETDKIIVNKLHTVYARFKVKTPTIIFQANGGKLENASKIVTYNSIYGELPVPSLSHYTFDGWYTAATGGTKITNSTIVNIVDSQALYAHWLPDTYTIEFDPNGGNMPTLNKTVTYESTYGTLPTPSKTGSTFLGWYTELTGGVQITSSSLVKIKSSQKVYARWK